MTLDEIRKLIDAATPGPWEAEIAQGDSIRRLQPDSRVQLNATAAWAVGPNNRSGHRALADARFIAASRTLLPLMLQALTELRESYECVGHYEMARDTFNRLDAGLAALEEP